MARSKNYTNMRVQVLRGCDGKPIESSLATLKLNTNPARYTVRITYEQDHPCQILSIQPLSENSEIDIFGYDLVKVADAPAGETETEDEATP